MLQYSKIRQLGLHFTDQSGFTILTNKTDYTIHPLARRYYSPIRQVSLLINQTGFLTHQSNRLNYSPVKQASLDRTVFLVVASFALVDSLISHDKSLLWTLKYTTYQAIRRDWQRWSFCCSISSSNIYVELSKD